MLSEKNKNFLERGTQMMELIISKEQAKEFAYECFDAIIRDIQAMQDEENNGEETNREIA